MMPVHSGYPVLILVLAWTCPLALAQEAADKPAPKVGDRWIFEQTLKEPHRDDSSTRRSFQVAEVLPDRITMVGGNGQSFQVDASLNPINPKGAEYAWTVLKFPLSVGNEWKYTVRSGEIGLEEHSGTYKVAAFEAVTVPAGTFNCFRVDGEWQTNGRGFSVRGSDKIWYCPAINFYVKRSSEFTLRSVADSYHPNRTERVLELWRFFPAGGQRRSGSGQFAP